MSQPYQNQVVEFVFNQEDTALILCSGASVLFSTHRNRLEEAGDLLCQHAGVSENNNALKLIVAQEVLRQLARHLWGPPRPGHATKCIIWYAADKAVVSGRPPYWIGEKDLKT